jgi:hypothetical protein
VGTCGYGYSMIVPLTPSSGERLSCLRHQLFFITLSAPILASARTIPERVKMAPGHIFAAAFINRDKSSSDIFTVTDSVLFPDMPLSSQAIPSTASNLIECKVSNRM